MKEDDSYCSSIQFNVTSYSSIPDENSSVNITIYADDNKLFRGSSSTTINIIAIPSAFETNVPSKKSNDGDTGYHVMLSGQVQQGSQYDNKEVQFTQDLYVLIQFELSDSALITKQNLTQTFIQLVGALLGSIFGLMGAIGGIMSFIESNQIKIKEKEEKKEKKKELRIKYLQQQLDELRQEQNIKQIYVEEKTTDQQLSEQTLKSMYILNFSRDNSIQLQKISQHTIDKLNTCEQDLDLQDSKHN